MHKEKEKDKEKKFKLNSSLRHLQENKKNQTQQFIQQLDRDAMDEEVADIAKPKEKKKHVSLFKLNPSSSALVSEIPVDVIRKRSKSNRLESLNDDTQKGKFNLLDHYKQKQDNLIKDRKSNLKKYNIDLRQMIVPDSKLELKAAAEKQEEQEQKYQIVKPSELYEVKKNSSQQVPSLQPTVFQTPILPCFASEFQRGLLNEQSKRINEGEGVWKIGRMKFKGGKCYLLVGEIEMEGIQVPGEGKAAAILSNHLYELPNWGNMWIMQPTDDLFAGDRM